MNVVRGDSAPEGQVHECCIWPGGLVQRYNQRAAAINARKGSEDEISDDDSVTPPTSILTI